MKHIVAIGVAIVAGLTVVGSAVTTMRAIAVLRAQQGELQALKDKVAGFEAAQTIQDGDLHALHDQVNGIEGTLYRTDTAPPIRRQSVAELWQRNQIKELKDAIHQLELWRYRMEKP